MENSIVPFGFCHCGCGGKTAISQDNDQSNNRIKGMPMRYLTGHHVRGRKGEKCGKWKGGRVVTASGYVLVHREDHPRADKYGHVHEHILVVEENYGRHLHPQNVVHHINGIKADNRIENLLVCENTSAHTQLHTSLRAESECGNADWRRCFVCKKYDDPTKMVFHCGSYVHAACNKERRRKK